MISAGLVNTNFGELKPNWNPTGKDEQTCYQNNIKSKEAKFKFSNPCHQLLQVHWIFEAAMI